MPSDISEILGLMTGKKVFIFGTSEEINKLFLTPNNLEVMSDTAVRQRPGTCVLEEVIINLSTEKRNKIKKIFNDKFKKKDSVTIGVNYFSVYFPVDIAWWADISGRPMTREILNKSKAKYKCCNEQIFDMVNEEAKFENLTHTFKWYGYKDNKPDYKNCDIPTEYDGYLWWWRTGALGALHMAALGKPSSISISGVEWDPLKAHHFYEDVNLGNTFGFVHSSTLDQTEKFITAFPDIKFTKTSETSYVPFDYKSLDDVLNE